MEAIPSGSFLEEFTLVADRVESGETFLIERPKGESLVLISLAEYNAMQKKLYEARKK